MGLRGVCVAIVALSVCGCAEKKNPAAEAELQQVKRQTAALNASLDDLGVRLLESQNRVLADAELQRRHKHVSQIACANLAGHWAGINRFLNNQRVKARRLRTSRVAAAEHHRD